MQHASKIIALTIFIAGSNAAMAADDQELTTQWGHPDLQGVWNFSTEVPFQRAEQYGEREFLTAEEIAEIQARLEAEAAAGEVVQADEEVADRGAPSTLSLIHI